MILVGHSWGGSVITEAGADPRVKALVYVAAFAPDKSETAASLGESVSPTMTRSTALLRAVESVIGDPPRDERRFVAKLAEIGINPDEKVGYVTKIPIHQMIRLMNEARDKRSAHGSTLDRKIRPAALLDFQACAEVIVTAALEKVRGSLLVT